MEHIYSFHMYIDFKIAISILEIDTHTHIHTFPSLSLSNHASLLISLDTRRMRAGRR